MKIKLLTILLTLLPLMTWAQGTTAGDETNAEPYAVLSENNTVLTFYYDDQKTTRNGLEVGPFNGDGIQTWYWQRESIINAVFDSSFANCTSITSTAHWFNGCKNMSSVSGIQYLKTDNVTDMKDMFSYCRSLPSIDVSGFNTSNVMTMSGMFALCESLTSLDVSGFKTDKVINMSSMFNSCKSLTTLDVSGFNTANVTDMAGMFFSCTSLTDLNLSNFNTANVTTMNSMFHYCIGLTNLDVSNFNTEKVTSMASMFWNCHSLTSLNISSFVTPYVTNVEDMFSECSSLTTILVGKGWSTGQISNGESMFAGCVNLVGEAGTTFDESHIDFTYAHIDGGISNPGYFSGNGVPYAEPYAALSNQNTVLTFYYDDQKKARQGMSIGPFSSDYIYNSGYIGWEQQRDSITSVVFDDSFSNYTDLISTVGWFFNCSKLETVSGLQNIHLGKLEDMSYMFYHCSALKSLDLSYFSEANLTKIEYMLTGCSGLTELNLGGFNTANITDMNSMFSGCSGLTSLDLSSLNTENVTSMSSMFSGCSGLTSLDLSNFKTEHVTSMAAMFNNCSHLTSLDLSNFNTENVTTMYYMFNGCSRLKSLNMSGLDMTSLNDILYMFSGCSYLESIDLSNSVLPNLYRFFYGLSSLKELNLSNCNTSKMTTMKEMFSGCSKLITLDLSSFNTTNVTDMYCMFYDCPDLVSIDLSSFNTVNVTSMESMFSACPNLMSIDVSGFNTESVTDMSSMFLSCPGLTSLDVTNFNTANVTNISHMFGSCTGLTSLDLRNFNTGNVTDMGYMFSGCTSLNTIYAGEGWSTAKVSSSSYMFHQCTSLVGGAGTVFDSSHTDHTYARIDGGTDNPGYFTRIGDAPYTEPEPYAVLSEDNTVLTFYYDDQKAARGGIAIGSYGPANYEPWYENRTTLTTAVFDESFANDTTLTSTAYWFHECIKLTEIKGLEYLKTDKVTDMRNMFYGCSKLTTLDVSHFKTGNVTNMNLMFYYCSGLTSLDVKGFNTENVTDMGSMFNNCSGLKSLDISSFKTEKVKNMIQMFYQCYNLTTIYVGNGWSTASVTADYGYHMFTDCTALVGGMGTTYDENHVDFTYAHIDEGPSNPGYFTRSGDAPYTEPEPYAVLSENNTVLMFYYDEKKTERNGMSVGPFAAETDRGWDEYKGNINTAIFDDSFANCSTITSTAYWFASCYNSLTIQGLNNLKTDNVTDMTMMFHSTWLKDVDVSGFNTSKVTSMRNMFSACSMSSLDVSNFNTENVIDFNGMFSSNSHLTSLDLKNFNTANATSLRAMFSGCTQLTNIDLSSFNTANVTDMNNMFSSCTNLQHLDLSHFNTDKVRDIRRMFLDCRNLTSLDISSLKTDSVLSMEMLFENCAKLESLDLSSFNTKDIWEMRYMFDGCSNLKTIYVSSEWNTGKVSSGENMFRNCTNLVGGKGTTYDANHVDYTYARIDGGPSNPGYFTDKNAQADDGLELYAIDVESEMKSNETFMPTQSVKMTLGNDSEWSTNNDLAPELGGELKFDANIYYPGIYNKNYAFVSSVVGTNNPAAGPLVDGMSTGSSYKPRWRNLPESGAYFIFESEQDGSLIVPIRINPNKPLYVTDDAGVPLIAYQLKDQDGVTVALDANSSTAEKTIAFLSLNVSKNQKYYIFCKGSKPRVGGYIFAPHTIDIDPATTAAALDSLLAEPVDATFDSNGVLSVGGGTTMADALEYVGGRAEVAKTITAIVWNSTASLTNDDLKGLDNPNMLIYVKDAAFAPANRDNVVIGDFAKNIVLTDVESGNNNFYCPQAFTAEMISYTHEYRQQTEIGVARGWETIALPFTVQTIMHEKWGGIVPFGNSNSGANFWLRQMTSNGLQRATKIEANVPYIISMPNNETYDAPNNLAGRVTFSSQDALVPMTEYTSVHMAVENGMLMFVPCFQTTQAHDMIYALNVGETRGNHPEGSVFEANYRDVRPFEAFTVHEGGNKPAPQFILVFDLNQAGFTGIENVRSHMCDGRSDVWYNLNGRRLQQKPTQKGVYLNNRCKVIIR